MAGPADTVNPVTMAWVTGAELLRAARRSRPGSRRRPGHRVSAAEADRDRARRAAAQAGRGARLAQQDAARDRDELRADLRAGPNAPNARPGPSATS